MGGTDGPRKRPKPLTYDTREPLRLRFVGGPYDGTERVVDSDRYYALMISPDDAFELLFPPNDEPIEITAAIVRQGTYERGLNYHREMVMRWLGWDDEREYERMVMDNESPDYHG